MRGVWGNGGVGFMGRWVLAPLGSVNRVTVVLDRWQLGKYVGDAAGGLPQWEVAWRMLIRANLAGNVGEAS